MRSAIGEGQASGIAETFRMTELHWLPILPDWRARLRALATHPSPWDEAVGLANARLNFVLTNGLDEITRRVIPAPPTDLSTKPVRLAVLCSSTLAHLHGAIRVAGLRRGIWIDTYENEFGQYLQELSDPSSALHEFRPTAVLFAFDAYHVCAGLTAGLDEAGAAAALAEVKERIREAWRLAREAFRCPVLQQTILPVHPALLGSNEHRLPGSRAAFVSRLNHDLREMADAEGIDLVALDARAAVDGVGKWHD